MLQQIRKKDDMQSSFYLKSLNSNDLHFRVTLPEATRHHVNVVLPTIENDSTIFGMFTELFHWQTELQPKYDFLCSHFKL